MTIYLKNFYSTIQQYSTLASTAFDEGPILNIAAVGINSSSINTIEVDPFRHGVEITQNKHAYAGLFKISAGTPGHIIRPVCIGANDDITIVSSEYYVEVDPFNPVTYLKLSSSLERSKMIGTEEDFLDRKLAYNGVIEPLTIRAVEGFLSNEHPYQLHSIKGEFLNGNLNKFSLASDEVLTVDYIPKKTITYLNGSRLFENKAYFLDRLINPGSPGSGTLSGLVSHQLPQNGSVKYFLVDLSGSNIASNLTFPFDDSKKYLQSMGVTTTTHGQDLVNVFNIMTGSTGNYVPPGKKSATTGFVYDNIGYAGVDSIAFGGMTY
jgi:hypothetical protein